MFNYPASLIQHGHSTPINRTFPLVLHPLLETEGVELVLAWGDHDSDGFDRGQVVDFC